MPARLGATLAVAAVLAIILHGSLWPYDFVDRLDGIGPVATFIGSIAGRPHLTDFTANVLLYIPLGVTLIVALPGGVAARASAVVLAGSAVSLGVELTQYYELERVTDFYDLVANATGTAVGVLAALAVGASTDVPFLRQIVRAPVPAMLIGAMLGYRLSPYVPAADLHKYWQAIKPLLALPWPEPWTVLRYISIWLAAAEFLAEIFGSAASLIALPILGGFVLLAKVLLVESVVNPAELVSLPVVFVVWLVVHRWRRGRVVLVAAALFLQVAIDRLQPFEFQRAARPFGWLPFRGFLTGSLAVNVASFFEKLFLYGGLFWLLWLAGLRRMAAAAAVAMVLLVTSIAETHLPARSAEITDALMALIASGLIAWLADAVPGATARPAPAAGSRARGASSPRAGGGR